MGKIEGKTPAGGRTHARLGVGWLALVRAVWVAVTAASLGLFALSVPSGFGLLRTVCTGGPCGPEQLRPEAARAVRELGVSLDVYAAYQTALVVVFALVFCAIAAVVFWRRSDDAVALYTSLTLVLCGVFLPDWVGAFTVPSSLWPLVDLLNSLTFCSLFVLFYVFPDGRFTPRWTFLPALAWVAMFGAHHVLPEGPLLPANWPPVLRAAAITALICTCLFAQAYRYRRVSGPAERQQTKWVVLGLVAMLGVLVLVSVLPVLEPSLEVPGRPYDLGVDLVSFAAVLLVPLSFGFAILRYRLFDIDVIVNRALVYGVLTVSLAALYAGTVAGSQYVLGALTGEGDRLAVVASTLTIAALFSPLRRRIQGLIDRAFYRRKYDAARVLEAHAAGLRDVTDLASLGEGLTEVVAETVRPAHVSLWLREPAHGPRETAARNGHAAGKGRTREGPAGAVSGGGPQSGGGEP